MTIRDVREAKESLEKKTTKGFGYFIKNVLMVILIFICIFIATNPNCVMYPTEFFKDFDRNSLWVVGILFTAIGGFYQLSKSVASENKEELSEHRINDYEKALQRKEEQDKEKHASLLHKRLEASPLIANELKRLIIELDSDRAAILEMHNGTNNLAGLPCIYGDMIFEEISPRVHYARDEFKNFNLARLPFVALHYKDKGWIGSVDEIEKEDAYFAAKLRMVEVEYGVCVVLEGIDGPLGFLTVFFKDAKNVPPKAKIMAEINHSSQIISTLLDITD